MHPNLTVYILVDARAALDSSSDPFVGLAGRDVNFAVAEQVVVRPTTTIVVSFAEPV